MNYTELQAAIISDTHRGDLASEVPRFIRECEALIRQNLTAYELVATLTDSDRVTDGLYTLPGRILQIRSVHLVGRQGDSLDRVGPGQIRRLDTTADVLMYAQHGDDTIEFRGVPTADESMEVRYYGTPAPLEDVATNTLLDDHENLYMAGSMYYLYKNEQDRTLQQDNANEFDAIVERINEQMARKIGGQRTAPTYNMSSESSY